VTSTRLKPAGPLTTWGEPNPFGTVTFTPCAAGLEFRFSLPSEGDGQGWAEAVLTASGLFSAVGDFGAYALLFQGEAPVAALLDLGGEHLDRFRPWRQREYDGERTAAAIRSHLLYLWRSERLSLEAARREWKLLAQHGQVRGAERFIRWYEATSLPEAYRFEVRSDPQAELFLQRTLPRLQRLAWGAVASHLTREVRTMAVPEGGLNEHLQRVAHASYALSVRLAEALAEGPDGAFRQHTSHAATLARAQYARLKALLERRGWAIAKPQHPPLTGQPARALLASCAVDMLCLGALALKLAEWLMASGDRDGAAHTVAAGRTVKEQAQVVRALERLLPGEHVH
jgi:hypothetical protein